jgi:hypothetical protein
LVWTAIFLLLMLLLMGLSLDTAKVALVMHQLHNAADAGALAGAPWVKRDRAQARLLAQLLAGQNFADKNGSAVPQPVLLDLNVDNLADGDIIVGLFGYDPVANQRFFLRYDPTATEPTPVNALAVIASRDQAIRVGHQATQSVALNFGSIANVDSVDVRGNWEGKRGPYAIAITGGGTGAGLVCLRRDGTGLHLQGNADLTINNITDPPVFEEGAIQINSFDDELCLTTNGGPMINSDLINICANGCTQVGNFQLSETDTQVWYGQPPMPDPLGWFKTNPPQPGADLGTIDIKNNTQVPANPIPAGYYSGGMTFKGGTAADPIYLASGTYVLDGAGLQVLAGAYVVVDPAGGDADGDGIGEAFFYIRGTDWEGDGTVCYVSGNAVVRADPLSSGLYAGIIVAQNYLNLNDAEITGTGATLIEGTLYFPQHRPVEEQSGGNGEGFALRLGGTGLGTGNQVIADSVYIFGTGDKIINYDGRNPSPISKAWLVE